MVTSEERKSYRELLIILEELNLLNKIPKSVLDIIIKKQDMNWVFQYNEELPLEKQNILRSTAILFSTIYLAFICNDSYEKKELQKIYVKNQKNKEHQKKLIMENNIKKVNTLESECKEMILISNPILDNKKQGFLEKICKFFKELFKKNT